MLGLDPLPEAEIRRALAVQPVGVPEVALGAEIATAAFQLAP